LIFLNCDKFFFNAGATSCGTRHALIVIGKKLIEKMSDQGIKGTLAHELAHIKHNHSPKLMATAMGLLMGLLLVTAIMCDYNFSKEIKNTIKSVGMGAVIFLVLFFLVRRWEEQADDAAIYKFGVAEDFVSAMQEIDHEIRDEFDTYKKEMNLLRKNLETLYAKSPKMARFLGWITKLYDSLTRTAYEDTLDGNGGDHPSVRQRIAAGKKAIEKRAKAA
jgi:Zn-dependent protease with chaperone function